MKSLKLLLFSLVATNYIFAFDIEDKVVEYKDKVANDIVNGKNTATLYIGAGLIDMQPTYKNVDFLEIKNNPLLMMNVSVTLFPDTLDLSIGYSKIMDNSGSDTSDVEYTDIYLKPFKTSYGDIGFGYKKSLFNTTITNISDYDLTIFDMKQEPYNPDDPSAMYVLKPNKTLNVQTKEERYIIGYNLPIIKYIPNGLGFQYSQFEGHKPSIGSKELILAKQYITNGTRFDLGINKTKKELTNGFNIKRLGIYSIDYDTEYYNVGMQRDEVWPMGDEGYYLEIVYKNKFNLFSSNGNYLISIYRDVLESSEDVLVESGETQENGEPVWVPNGTQKKLSDITQGIYFELSFNF